MEQHLYYFQKNSFMLKKYQFKYRNTLKNNTNYIFRNK